MDMKEGALASVWLWLTLAACVFMFFAAPHQLGVLVWSLSKLSAGAFIGYWADRSFFTGQRPLQMQGDPIGQRHASYRRAAIVSAFVIGAALSI